MLLQLLHAGVTIRKMQQTKSVSEFCLVPKNVWLGAQKPSLIFLRIFLNSNIFDTWGEGGFHQILSLNFPRPFIVAALVQIPGLLYGSSGIHGQLIGKGVQHL